MSSDLMLCGAKVALRPSKQARMMRLRVDPRTGGIVLSFPHRLSQRRAILWASGQQRWIEAALAGVPSAVGLEPGATVPWQGEPHRIDWAEANRRTVSAGAGAISVGGPRDLVERRILRWMKAQALEMLTRETHHYAGLAGVTVERVGIGDAISRWGSCSSSGTIRYSWRLMLAPAWVRQATVAHEVAHRVHMNHGPDFHALVERLLGADPKPARDWLRRHGGGLHRFGRSASVQPDRG